MARLTTQITVMLHEDDLSYVDAKATIRRVSRADIIREAIARMRRMDETESQKRDTPYLPFDGTSDHEEAAS